MFGNLARDKEIRDILEDIRISLRKLSNRDESAFPLKSKDNKDFKIRIESSRNLDEINQNEDFIEEETKQSKQIKEILKANENQFFPEDAIPLELLDEQ